MTANECLARMLNVSIQKEMLTRIALAKGEVMGAKPYGLACGGFPPLSVPITKGKG